MSKITNELYYQMVNEGVRLQSAHPNKELSKIVENLLSDYDFKLKDLSENEKSDLAFQITYSLVKN